jgi:hypothetical protein
MRSIELIVHDYLKGHASKEEVQHLHENLPEWKTVLGDLLKDLMEEESALLKSKENFESRYVDEPKLLEAARDGWYRKNDKLYRKLEQLRWAITEVDQLIYAQKFLDDMRGEQELVSRIQFLQTAIQAHKDSTEDLRPQDQSLYDALAGKWTFTEMPK